MQLEVVKFLKQNSLNDLCNKYSIIQKRHQKYSHLVLLKYDQLNSDFSQNIVKECRGIILDELNDWNVVCLTYTKFFNIGEGHAAKINWDSARVYEKLDGSLCQLYFYDNKWNVSTSGTPDASGKAGDFDFTFEELFWNTWNELKYELPTDIDCCYAFELCTKYNRVVVQHKKDRIVLHGGRDLKTFRELNPIIEAHNNKWECVKTFPLTSFDEIIEFAKTLDPMVSEGFVVCDADYNRVKMKSPQYVAMAHLKDSVGMSKRQLVEIVRNNESDEFLSYFPEYSKDYYDVKVRYERLLGRIEGFYEAIKNISDRKIFASYATTQNFSGLLFNLKFGKIKSFRAGLAEMHIKSLEQLLGIKTEEG